MANDDDWTLDFFSGIALELWRRAMPQEVTEEEAEFLVEELEVEAGALLLDIACGNGRVALALAREGYRVEGLDQAREFVSEASFSAERESLPVAVRREDMRRLASIPEWEEAFDGAYCLGNSFAFFDRQGVRDFLEGVAYALKPGACFVMDTSVAAESVLPDLEDRAWQPVGDWVLLAEKTYHITEGRLDTDYTFITGEGSEIAAMRETRRASYWIFTVAEIMQMFREAGLEVDALYSDHSRTPFRLGDPKLIISARKTE